MTILLYLLLGYILVVGFIQYTQLRNREEVNHPLLKKSLVPLGALATVLGFMAMVNKIREAFDAIAAAGDISPAMVAGGISQAYPLLTLGLLCLAISLIFRYFNR
jgi:biopolymer transport protein ExbB/TolQ